MGQYKFRKVVRFCIAVIVLIGFLIAAPEARAQEPITVQVVQLDESRFPEIDVYVSAIDANGQPVTDIKPEDFGLEENGQSIPLAHVSQAGEQGPVTAVLVIDKSGSMGVADKMEAAQEAAIAFVELMRPGDATGVIAFNAEVEAVHSLTGAKETLVEAIRGIEARGDTALYDALHEASAMLEPVSGRKAIIAVTDGMSNSDRHTLEETMALIGEQGISIYTIGLGDPTQGTEEWAGIDEETLQAIADESNGTYQFAPEPEELSSLYELLSLRLQNEYKLTYQSPNQLRDGTKRDVVVSVVAASGTTEVAADYNPGGVIPEVAPRSTWRLFVPIFAVLAFLLILPGVVGRVGALVPGRAGGKKRGRAKSAKGRIRLTGESDSTGRRRQRR
jgi:Ca-activated chloride channel family protein